MEAIYIHKEKDLRIDSVETPRINPDEIKVKIANLRARSSVPPSTDALTAIFGVLIKMDGWSAFKKAQSFSRNFGSNHFVAPPFICIFPLQ